MENNNTNIDECITKNNYSDFSSNNQHLYTSVTTNISSSSIMLSPSTLNFTRVGYISYGSNLCLQRFLAYIQGGTVVSIMYTICRTKEGF